MMDHSILQRAMLIQRTSTLVQLVSEVDVLPTYRGENIHLRNFLKL